MKFALFNTRNLSIKWRMMLSFSLIFAAILAFVKLVTLFGLPFHPYSGRLGHERSEAFIHLNRIANQKKQELLNWIQDKRDDIHIFSENTTVRDNAAALSALTRALKNDGISQSEISSRSRKSPYYAALRSHLNAIRSTHDFYRGFHIDNAETGAILAATFDINPKTGHIHPKHLMRAALSRDDYIEDIAYGIIDRIPILHISRMIRDKDGRTIAVLTAGISATDVIAPLINPGCEAGESAEAILVNREQKILTGLKFPLPDGSRAEPLVFMDASKSAMLAARGEEGIIEDRDYRGVDVLAAYRHVRFNPDWGWGIVVKIDRMESFAPLYRDMYYSLTFGGLGIVLVIFATVMISKKLTGPLEAVGKIADRVAGGDLNARAPVNSTDEIGRMSAAFNAMIDRVQHWNAELEKEVRARTDDLNRLNLELKHEIAERRQVSDILDHTTRQWRATFNAMRDLVFLMDGEGMVKRCNKAACDLLAKRLDEIIDKRYHEAIYGLRVPAEGCPYQQTLRTKSRATATLQFSGKWFDITVDPLLDDAGGIMGAVYIMNDVTERRRLEEEMLKMQKLESIGMLAGGIAHDFNNLLTGIMGNIQLAALSRNSEETMTQRIADAERSCMRARDLTQRLLTFARGGAPVKKTASIRPLIIEATELALAGTAVKCDFSIADDLKTADVDGRQISQVVHNIVTNAVEAMSGCGTLRVSCSNATIKPDDIAPLPGGEYVKAVFEDCGVGIPRENIDRIFEPYFTTKKKGSGLGLAAAYSIVKNHGGSITVESEPAKGTVVSIYLPASPKAPSAAGPRAARGSVFGKRVLVMDDEDIVRNVAGEMLRHMGCVAALARDGAEAVELYVRARDAGRPFDAVIMDLTVPGGIGGVEAVEKLREFDPSVKAIVSSGYSNDPIMSAYREHGFSGVVVKPYKINDLMEALKAVL